MMVMHASQKSIFEAILFQCCARKHFQRCNFTSFLQHCVRSASHKDQSDPTHFQLGTKVKQTGGWTSSILDCKMDYIIIQWS